MLKKLIEGKPDVADGTGSIVASLRLIGDKKCKCKDSIFWSFLVLVMSFVFVARSVLDFSERVFHKTIAGKL